MQSFLHVGLNREVYLMIIAATQRELQISLINGISIKINFVLIYLAAHGI